MKKYRVGFHYIKFASLEVEAETEQEAHLLVLDILDDEGVPNDADVFQTEWAVDRVEEKI